MVSRRAAKAAGKLVPAAPVIKKDSLPTENTVDSPSAAILLRAVEYAAAAIEGMPSEATGARDATYVGTHIEARLEADGLAVHEFECTNPAYPNWRWTVVLALADTEAAPTVCDVVLLPGPGALIPSAWVPWHERLQPGDLRPGDVVPTNPDDPRLVPGYTGEGDIAGTDEDQLREVVWELGLGRERVLSPTGRDDAADRWQEGSTGPDAPEAKQAPLPCLSCGFMVPIGGQLGQNFAICANIISPADGKVVSLSFGCGAHSEITASKSASQPVGTIVDTLDYEDLDIIRE